MECYPTKFLPESEWTQDFTLMDVDPPVEKKIPLKRRLVPQTSPDNSFPEPWSKPSW